MIYRWKSLASLQTVGSRVWLSCLQRSKKKVKCNLVQALRLCTGRTAHRRSRGIALLFLDRGIRRGEGSASRPGRSLLPGKTRYPLYRKLGGPQGRSGQVWKISSPPGFDPRTIQPVASRYTDYATRPTVYKGVFTEICSLFSGPNFTILIIPAKVACSLWSVPCRLPYPFSSVCFEEGANAKNLRRFPRPYDMQI